MTDRLYWGVNPTARRVTSIIFLPPIAFHVRIDYLLVNTVNQNDAMPRKKKQELKERLLDSARLLLAREGYRNFSLREVARDVGVSATSVYLHFEGKDDLIHTLMEESIDLLNNKLEEVSKQSLEPIKKLEALAHQYVEFALQNPREYQVIYMVGSDEMTRYPKEKFRKARRGYEIIINAIEEGIKKGLLDEPQPRIAAYTFWAQLHGVMSVVLSKRLDTRINQNEFIEQAIDHIIYGFHVRTALEIIRELR